MGSGQLTLHNPTSVLLLLLSIFHEKSYETHIFPTQPQDFVKNQFSKILLHSLYRERDQAIIIFSNQMGDCHLKYQTSAFEYPCSHACTTTGNRYFSFRYAALHKFLARLHPTIGQFPFYERSNLICYQEDRISSLRRGEIY